MKMVAFNNSHTMACFCGSFGIKASTILPNYISKAGCPKRF